MFGQKDETLIFCPSESVSSSSPASPNLPKKDWGEDEDDTDDDIEMTALRSLVAQCSSPRAVAREPDTDDEPPPKADSPPAAAAALPRRPSPVPWKVSAKSAGSTPPHAAAAAAAAKARRRSSSLVRLPEKLPGLSKAEAEGKGGKGRLPARRRSSAGSRGGGDAAAGARVAPEYRVSAAAMAALDVEELPEDLRAVWRKILTSYQPDRTAAAGQPYPSIQELAAAFGIGVEPAARLHPHLFPPDGPYFQRKVEALERPLQDPDLSLLERRGLQAKLASAQLQAEVVKAAAEEWENLSAASSESSIGRGESLRLAVKGLTGSGLPKSPPGRRAGDLPARSRGLSAAVLSYLRQRHAVLQSRTDGDPFPLTFDTLVLSAYLQLYMESLPPEPRLDSGPATPASAGSRGGAGVGEWQPDLSQYMLAEDLLAEEDETDTPPGLPTVKDATPLGGSPLHLPPETTPSPRETITPTLRQKAELDEPR